MKVYSEVRAVIASVVTSGKLPNEKHGGMQGQERAEALQRRRKHFDKIEALYKEFESLIEPCVAMRQRRPLL